jgi:hypothetical protein
MKISVPIRNKQTIGSTILFALLFWPVHLFQLTNLPVVLVSKTYVANFVNEDCFLILPFTLTIYNA